MRISIPTAFLLWLTQGAKAMEPNAAAFSVFHNTKKWEVLAKEDESWFYEINKNIFDKLEKTAQKTYMENFWQKKSKEMKTSVAKAQENYFKDRIVLNEKAIEDMAKQVQNHPEMKDLSLEERKNRARNFIMESQKQSLIAEIIHEGAKKKEWKLLMEKPKEPRYPVKIRKDDHILYGPNPDQVTPKPGVSYPITIVEFFEFQCPYCGRVQDTLKEVLRKYEGRVRRVARDFPLDFHKQAVPAAQAAHCAGKQHKALYWKMYFKIFENQSQLSSENLLVYAKSLGVKESDFQTCLRDSSVERLIYENRKEGIDMGISGIPAYLINGRKLSGAVPFSEFEKIIKEELAL